MLQQRGLPQPHACTAHSLSWGVCSLAFLALQTLNSTVGCAMHQRIAKVTGFERRSCCRPDR